MQFMSERIRINEMRQWIITILLSVIPMLFVLMKKWTIYTIIMTIECMVLFVVGIYRKLYGSAVIAAIIWIVLLFAMEYLKNHKDC